MSDNKFSCNIIDYGAIGDGLTDDSVSIQNALDSDSRRIIIPKGDYRIRQTLLVPSNKEIIISDGAKLIHCGETPRRRGDFLLSNADTINGNVNITIRGGTWDGGYGGTYAVKSDDLFDSDACSGACLNFVNVKNLILEDMIVANSVIYYIRMARLENFVIRNISFFSDQKSYNQDGLHFGGCVKNGFVENIRAISKGQTNDDMIALNADDSVERLENRDLIRGDIENIYFRNIYAEDCYTAIRMLSVTAAIRNIKIENIECGCRTYAINMDGARYCRTPLFKENDYPNGVGIIENVEINNMKIYTTESNSTAPALIHCESNCENFIINGLERVTEKDWNPNKPTLLCKNVVNTYVETITNNVKSEHKLENKDDILQINIPFDTLFIKFV